MGSLEGTTGFGFTEKEYRGKSLSKVSLLWGLKYCTEMETMNASYVSINNKLVRDNLLVQLPFQRLGGYFQFYHCLRGCDQKMSAKM